MESISDKIKRLRKSSGISQLEVAKSAGITQSGFASIEKGDTKAISIEVGKGIAKALGISFNELFEIEVDSKSAESQKNEIDELKESIEELHGRIKELQERISEKDKIMALQEQINKNFKNSILEHVYSEWPDYLVRAKMYDEIMANESEEFKSYIAEARLKALNCYNERSEKFLEIIVAYGIINEKEIQSFFRRKKEDPNFNRDIVSDAWNYYDNLINPDFPRGWRKLD